MCGEGGGGGLLNPYLIYTSDVYSSEHWYKHGGHNATDDNVANNREIELRFRKYISPLAGREALSQKEKTPRLISRRARSSAVGFPKDIQQWSSVFRPYKRAIFQSTLRSTT